MENEKRIGLYIHIPFCQHKCDYCDFCSAVPRDRIQVEDYLEALCADIEKTAREFPDVVVDTLYLGGGTPSLLGKKDLRYLTDAVYDCFRVTQDAEFTAEANPATLNRQKARAMLDCGINRLSIGLQSAQDRELQQLSRIHTLDDFLDSYTAARRAGFENVSVDVMYGIPCQTVESFMGTLNVLADLDPMPEHISLYGLKIEEGTPFFERREELPLPNEDTEYKMYRRAREFLSTLGYSQYEISNYARPGMESRHNLRYWEVGEYLGVGIGAHSYAGGMRFAKTKDIDRYIKAMCDENAGVSSIILPESIETIDDRERETEYVMLGLRLLRGIDKQAYEAAFASSFDEKYRGRIAPYVKAGFMEDDARHCAFTPEGLYVSNRILSEILDL